MAATSRSTSVEAPPLACTVIPLSVAAMKRAAARLSTVGETSPLALPSSIASVRVASRRVRSFKRGANVLASGVQVPVLLGDGLAMDGRLALVEGGALDAARDHDLADVDPIGLELLREQAHQLVLRCVGDAEAHQAVLNHHHVHPRVHEAGAAVA